jgi:hypothetical protein
MIALPLKRMSRKEKLMALEAIWEDLTRDGQRFESPAWHKDELAATAARVASGKEKFVDWGTAKKKLRSR